MKTMKRFILLAVACALLAGTAEARPKRLEINVETPGTLAGLIPEKRRNSVTAITLSGTLDGADLRLLREMAGRDHDRNPTGGRLVDVDMSGVSFAEGGGSYCKVSRNGEEVTMSVTGRHSLPRWLFSGTNVERLVLPSRIDTLGEFSCAATRIKSITLPEGVVIGEQVFNGCKELSEVVFPQFVTELSIAPFRNCPALRTLSMKDVGCISAYAFYEMPALERVEINGLLGHIDGWNTFCELPALKSVDFRGAVFTTGGPKLFENCPELEEVTFHDVVIWTVAGKANGCPKMGRYRTLKPVFDASEPECFNLPDSMPDSERKAAVETVYKTFERLQRHGVDSYYYGVEAVSGTLYDAAAEYAVAGDRDTALRYLRAAAGYDGFDAEDLLYNKNFVSLLDEPFVQELTAGFDKPVEGISRNLATLRRSPAYVDAAEQGTFTYAEPSDSLLTRIREHFRVDSIAGTGDDISRIKNIMYWLHDEVRHNGSSSWPDCDFNAIELIELCRREGRGLNCRFVSMILNDLYLSVGIPSRFVTCQSKKYDTDGDCHVINMVWSESLRKWIWMDVSFAAYVTDENGLMLHPGEVRERLIDGRELILNADANHNRETEVGKEWYLEDYMAKNLYIMSAHTHSTSQSEGPDAREAGTYITLVPEGFDYKRGPTTSDAGYFWQAPR